MGGLAGEHTAGDGVVAVTLTNPVHRCPEHLFREIMFANSVQCHTRHVPRSAQPLPPAGVDASPSDVESGHFPTSLLYAAAKLYYTEDATQA